MPSESRDLRRSIAAAKKTLPPVRLPGVPVAVSTAQRKLEPIADAISPTAVRFAFLGAGQGGSRMVQSFWDLGYRRALVVNTTDMDFAGLAEELPKYSFQSGGAAKDMQRARQALEQHASDVYDRLLRAWGPQVDQVLICASLGGGTGSGTAPRLVQLARQYLQQYAPEGRVGVLVSLPAVTEGQQVARNAVTALRQLWDLAPSPLLVVDNVRIHELYQPGMLHLHRVANETIAQLVHTFNTLAATRSPLMSFDASEWQQLLSGGLMTLAAAEIPLETITSPADVSTAIREQLTQNILAGCDWRTGKKAALLFTGPESAFEQFSLDYFDAGFTQLDRIIGAQANEPVVIHRGLYLQDHDGLHAYCCVAGLEPPLTRLGELAAKAQLASPQRPFGSLADFLGLA
jgi:cell division GTPase FtsZ